MTANLERFIQAQDSGAYAQAIAELHAGAKRSHWIWFVFPQLAGLGNSPMARMYGLNGVDEATAYLRHPVLRERLLESLEAVRSHSTTPLRTLMGSEIDALKLVSSMTLFREAGRRTHDDEIARVADDILHRAAADGFPACAFTLDRCRPGL